MLLKIIGSLRVKYIPVFVILLIVLIYKFHPRHEVIRHTKCPHSWIRFRDQCYKLVKRVTTFNEAVTLCQSEGGHLPVINDKETNEFLINYPLPSPIVASKKSIDSVHESHVKHGHHDTSVYDHVRYVKRIWINVEPIFLSNFSGEFFWRSRDEQNSGENSEKQRVLWSNFSSPDPAQDSGLIDVGLPYVVGLTINGNIQFHIDKIKDGLAGFSSKEEERQTFEAISDHLNETGRWHLFFDLNVCGHCYAAICQKDVIDDDKVYDEI